MKKRFRWDKKYLYWGITGFCVIACAILFFMALNYISALGTAVKTLVKILSPFIWGLVICYLLAPLMRALERGAFLPLGRRLYQKSKKSNGERFARNLSVLVSEIIMLALMAALVYLILPQLYSSLETIVVNSNTYIANVTNWVTKMLEDYPEIERYASQLLGTVNTNLMDWIQGTVLPELGSLVTNVTTGVYYVLMGVYNLVIGIIVSVYILSNLEGFTASAKRMLYSLFPVETAEKIREGLAFTDRTFMGFINGKLLDSAIIGLICYIVCAILKMPYALLVSVIVGVTNVIPFFGPFIGAVPSAIIILMVSPLKCLIFIVFIIVLQQVDGNIIGPKILGSSIGINGFWVMFSIILGAGLFGFWGMLLGVPVFVVIYTAINSRIERRLKENDLPWRVEEYSELDHIDPVTRQAVKKAPPEDGEAES
ncbi:MAG: AI-2E family transporter [Firmicutes bacterium]|nr:AI-2E family transporter [Oscillospiraceae bacterium]MBS5433496.1 AI-2E family transporter [Bacillota bacterium]